MALIYRRPKLSMRNARDISNVQWHTIAGRVQRSVSSRFTLYLSIVDVEVLISAQSEAPSSLQFLIALAIISNQPD